MTDKTNKLGVIVGRFQVPDLHQGHKNLIDSVLELHTQIIIFLGQPMVHSTKENPLSFQARKLMLEDYLRDKYLGRYTILPIKDQKTNEVWSEMLDSKIREVDHISQVILYGGRDSFIPYYKGKFQTEVLKLNNSEVISGTNARNEIAKEVIGSREYRIGVINAIYNQYDVSYQTVDIACFDKESNRILLARKRDESKLRLIGGFVDPKDKSLESAAKRELNEETGGNLETSNYKYVGSYRIDDIRYHKGGSKIMTALFSCTKSFGMAKPSDDIYELHWVSVDEALSEGWLLHNVQPEHIDMLIKVLTENK